MALLRHRWRLVDIFVFFLAVAIFSYCYVVLQRPSITNTKNLWPSEVPARSYKSILIWKKDRLKNLGQGPVEGNIFEKAGCPVSQCILTENRSLMAVEEFDAIVFHIFGFGLSPKAEDNRRKFPAKRSPHQRYMFFLTEPPPRGRGNLQAVAGVFNWTMTTRLDADMPWPYGEMESLGEAPDPSEGWLQPSDPPIAPSAALVAQSTAPADAHATGASGESGGRALVAWLVSNCHSWSGREAYVRALSKHIRVDIYGGCGPLKWPRNDTDGFYRMLSANYTFYLSFENSLCRDYVTEKLFYVLPLDVVPVVHGRANYSAVAPPHSYIDTRDFASPKHLAQYLHFLARRPQELAKFWWWKRHYRAVHNSPKKMCRLCALLHDPGPPRVYEDILEWYAGPGVCEKPAPIKEDD